MSTIKSDANLLESSLQMVEAHNYNNWTYDQFSHFIRGSVLEVGCGTGSFTERIIESPSLTHLTSIDVSEQALDYCRKRVISNKVKILAASASDISGSFDLIVCMNVLEHIQDDKAALENMLNILKPGGVLFLLVPAHQFLYSSFDKMVGHFKRYTKSDIDRLISNCDISGSVLSSHYYFNAIGAVGYFTTYRIFKRSPDQKEMAEISIFDKWIVPIYRHLEGKKSPFGISIISTITRVR